MVQVTIRPPWVSAISTSDATHPRVSASNHLRARTLLSRGRVDAGRDWSFRALRIIWGDERRCGSEKPSEINWDEHGDQKGPPSCAHSGAGVFDSISTKRLIYNRAP
jgi:hypothetical protein